MLITGKMSSCLIECEYFEAIAVSGAKGFRPSQSQLSTVSGPFSNLHHVAFFA